MPKSRHRKHKHKNRSKSLLFNFAKEMEQIERLIEDGDLSEAMHRLKELAQRAPHRAEIFENMFLVAMELNDKRELLEAAIRLVELQPHVPAHHFNLYGVYKQNIFPALALRTGRQFIDRWPELDLARDIRKEVEKLSSLLEQEALKLQFPQSSWQEMMVLHEQVQVALSRNRPEEARRLATQLITSVPTFVSAYNNRSLAWFYDGELDAAIADARQALEIEPDNVHALSNLVRFLRLTNCLTEAREAAERLKTADSRSIDAWTKKAEAFSYLADDALVLQITEQADKAGSLFGEYADAFLLHLAGVAAARYGDEKRAKRYWQEAVKRAPSLSRAQAQLDDLNKPIGERDGAWPFELADWLSPRLFEDFMKQVEPAAESNNESAALAALKRYLQKHPNVTALVPVLLERGDPASREFAMRLAQFAKAPELLAALKAFAFSPNGPDALRNEAFNILQGAGILQNGQKVSMWVNGTQREVEIHNYRIDDIPYEKLPERVLKLRSSGVEALKEGDLDRAEQFFSQALTQAPASVSIQFNLAAIEVHRGNIKRASELMKSISTQHPQYPFALTELALIAMANNRGDEARELLNRLTALDHFHYDEFANYCKVQFLYFTIVDSNREAAKKWLDMWEQLLPDDSRLEALRPLLGSSLLARAYAKQLLAPLRE
jgi:tetratricopeptide (TPR) repeat protein